jgi:hypothetical protein
MSKTSGMVEFTRLNNGRFDMSTGFETAAGLPPNAGKRITAEYWAIFAVCYPAFLFITAVKRLMPRSWTQGYYYSACGADGRRESIHAEAFGQASTAATYAFMG